MDFVCSGFLLEYIFVIPDGPGIGSDELVPASFFILMVLGSFFRFLFSLPLSYA